MNQGGNYWTLFTPGIWKVLHAVFQAMKADQRERPILVYDHIGIRDQWVAHLKWLDQNISTVRAIRVAEAAWTLAAWEGQP